MSIPQHGPQFHKNQSWKVTVRAATTAAGTLATDYENGAVVDGVTLVTGDRFLVKDAAAPEENGIRVVAASGAPARALDFVNETEIVGAVVVVTEGTANAMTAWLCTTTPTITMDTTAIDFAAFGGGGGGGGGGGSLIDAGGYYSATDVEGALQELAAKDIGYQAHGSTGSTETFNATIGWHSATLNANCTFTLTGATSGLVAAMVLELLQDGTGSRLVTWPGSVVWTGGTAPTLSTAPGDVDVITLFSRDGGTTWYGFSTGGGGGGSDFTDDTGFASTIGGADALRHTSATSAIGQEDIGGSTDAYLDMYGGQALLHADASATVHAELSLNVSGQLDLFVWDDGGGSAEVTLGIDSLLLDSGAGVLSANGRSITLPHHASAPSSPVEGESYYDDTLHKTRTFDGTSWQNHF